MTINYNTESKLEVFNIGKKYKNRPVLRNVSLNVRRGEAVGLLGPNGAGKTTCFYCVTGLITPDYGDVHIDGQDITNLPMYRRARMGIGYLPQEASIFRSLSVEDNIKAVLEIVIDDESKRENMLEELLSEFSIAHLRKSPAIALSGGERRRLEIARALASQPYRPHCRRRNPQSGVSIETSRLRRIDYGPQRSRNAGHHRPCLYSSRRFGTDGRVPRRNRRQQRSTQGLSR